MQAKRVVRWGLSALCLTLGALCVGCTSEKAAAGLDSRHPLLRKAAVKRLGEKREMAYYDELVRVLRTDNDRLVRSQAAFAIGELNCLYFSVGFNALAEAALQDPSVFVRAAAATSLGNVRDARAIAVLVDALYDDARGEVAVRQGDRFVVYKACPADAARTSLEKIVRFKYTSNADTAVARRGEMSAQWENWYAARRHMLPDGRAFAKK